MYELAHYIAGEWVDGAGPEATVNDKYTGDVLASYREASEEQVDQAVRSLATAPLPPRERAAVLRRTSAIIDAKSEDFVACIVAEGGFPLADAQREVARTVQTLALCAVESERIGGHVVPIEAYVSLSERVCYTIRKPRGVVCAITPFNSPLNTVVHKVAPALAAGNSVILKPATYTPLTSKMLVEALLEAGAPPTHLALVLGGGGRAGQWLIEHPVPDFYAFTGGTDVGEHIHRTVGLRPVQLELGSLSSTFICADADLDDAVGKCVTSAFRKAGQICTSIQRLYIEDSIFDDVVSRILELLREKKAGDPRDPETFVGPMISEGEAQRVAGWIDSAVESGAKLLAGGRREGAVVWPTVLTEVELDAEVMCKEIFGPVLVLRPFTDFRDALAEANGTPFGLAAGVFTNQVDRAMVAINDLQVGSVHVNETSNGRLDVMPYHGVKASGLGVEGPRYAIEEMSEERLVTIRSVGAGRLG